MSIARMPELWLKYGSTEVVLDIKAENLLDYVIEDEQSMAEEQINAKFDALTYNGSAHIVILDTSFHLAKLSLMLVDSIKKRGIENISIETPQNVLNTYKGLFQDRNAQLSKLSSDPAVLNDAILLSRTSFDPLFGYAGAPVYLLRYFGNGEMLEAYEARQDNMPHPGGTQNRSLSMAHKFAERYTSTSIEVVMVGRSFSEVIVDKPVKSHNEAISKLESMGTVEVEKSKASIVSAGNGHSTLSSALNSFWNCLDPVNNDGMITLLAECKDGFGAEALQMLVDGKITLEDVEEPPEYVDGLENLLYLKEVGKNHNLSLVSALPDYYTKNRLGLKTFWRTKDALHNILNAYGPKQKVLVVSDASKIMLKPKLSN